MATPKKKISKSRRNMRRYAAGNRLEKTTLTTCTQCNDLTRPHRICKCGNYAGTLVMKPKARKSAVDSEMTA